MKNVFIVADDTTGANSSAILHKSLGYDCVSIHTEVKEIRKQSVYAFSTNSRGVEKEEAYKRVKKTLDDLPIEDAVYCKRVDSTLRGNLGRELDAFLDTYQDKTAIVVASFPSSGRICKHNKLYVHGELLETTDVAKDPKMPVTTSVVTDLFGKQSDRTIGHIDLDSVHGEDFDQILLQAYQNNDVVVVDAGALQDNAAITILERVDEPLMVSQMGLACLSSANYTLELCKQYSPALADKIKLVINRYSPKAIIEKKEIQQITHKEIFAEIVEDCEKPLAAINKGIPLIKAYPNCPSSKGIRAIAQKLVKPERKIAKKRFFGLL